MNTDQSKDIHIAEIQSEYQRIDRNWLTLHYKISIGLVLFAFLVECFIGIIVINSDMLSTSVSTYLLKFLLAPSLINLLAILADSMVLRSQRFSQNQKIYTVSLMMVFICFILFSVHNAFIATYMIFAVAILLTVIYADFRLTGVTAASSILALVISELFITWDLDKASVFDSTLRFGDFLVAIFVLFAAACVCLVEIHYERKKNEASILKEIERQQLRLRLQRDEMTGAYNRKALHDALRDMESDESGDSFVFVVVDIDNFKTINDQYGHLVGDRFLVEFVKTLRLYCADTSVFRYGGDEFCLFFRNEGLDAVIEICRNIQAKLNQTTFDDLPGATLLASFGIAVYSNQDNAARLFIHADQALYQAKKTRNSIHVF
jgi:diguanylate cyclase